MNFWNLCSGSGNYNSCVSRYATTTPTTSPLAFLSSKDITSKAYFFPQQHEFGKTVRVLSPACQEPGL